MTTYTLNNFKKDQDDFNIISGQADNTSPLDIKNQLDLIKEEVFELDTDIQTLNFEGIVGETVDVLFTALGLVQKLENKGINMKKAMKIIAEANLSKFPLLYSDAEESEEFYKNKGINVKVSYNEDYEVYVIKDENDKVRKSVNFVKADVSSCVPEELK